MLIVATSLFLFAFPTLATALPRFEVHWKSEKSYEDVDPLVSPWHIRLGKLLEKRYEKKFPILKVTLTLAPLGTSRVRTW